MSAMAVITMRQQSDEFSLLTEGDSGHSARRAEIPAPPCLLSYRLMNDVCVGTHFARPAF